MKTQRRTLFQLNHARHGQRNQHNSSQVQPVICTNNSMVLRPNTPLAALEALQHGHQRYLSDRPLYHMAHLRRHAVARAQHPFAVILGCADSRVSPEILFDQNLGDVFVVRVAGNTLSSEILGSIEYAVSQFSCALVVVLGHERCGAVQAAVSAVTENSQFAGHIQAVVDAVQPAVLAALQQNTADVVSTAVQLNVCQTVQRAQASGVLQSDIAQGALQVVGATYDLDRGEIHWL